MLNFRIQKHCDDLLLCFSGEGWRTVWRICELILGCKRLNRMYELSAAGQLLTFLDHSRAYTNKMASASGTTSD